MRRAKQSAARTALAERKRRRDAIASRWQAEMSPPADRNPKAFDAMCAMYPEFAAAARKIGTLK